MGVLTKIQPSFASGELSPFLYSRVDLARYQTGLKTLKNFYIHPHGGASNRPGTKYAATSKDSTKESRLVKFIFSSDQAYALEFGHQYIRFYKNHGQILSGGSPYEVTTTYDSTDLSQLRFERSADVLYIFHPDYPVQTLSRYADDDWQLEEYSADDGPFMPENLDTSVKIACSATGGTAAITLTASGGAIFDSDHVGALFKLTHYVAGQSVAVAFSGTASSTSISCFTTWRIISHGTWAGKVRIEKSTDGGSTWTALRDFSSSSDFNINTYGTEDIETNPVPFLIRVTCYSYSSGTCNVDLTSDPFYQSGIARIATVVNSSSATANVLTSFGSTAATSSWSEGAWSDHRGYPALGAFHQDRLCFAASNAEPMNIWMTQTGNYESFRVNSTLLATDAINVKLLARQLNAVNGLAALSDLVALTSATEWRIGADKTTLSPDTVFAKTQGYRGSSGVTPVIIGNQLIYVQANGSVIRNFGYDFSIDSYTGVDLRILSEHLFTRYNIIDMDYQQDPDSLVWCVRDDGKLLSMTYMQEQDVIAWAQHETDGLVESICVIPADGYDELWMIVNRDGTRFVEYMAQRMESNDVQDQYFVDCGITYDSPIAISGATSASPVVITASDHGLTDGDIVDISDVIGMTELNGNRYKVANATTHTFELYSEESQVAQNITDENGNIVTTEEGEHLITELSEEVRIDGTGYSTYVSGGYVRKVYNTFSGLTHLNGRSVVVLGNGEVYPEQTVTNGEITLTRACSRVQVGLPYTCDFETLNVEVGLRSGSTQGKPMKISNVTFRVIESRGGWIGPDSNNLHEGFIPDRTALGTPPLLFTGDVREALGAGFEAGGRVFFRQYDPLPISITAVIPEVTVY